jgi:hypothetical protein
VSPEAVLSFAAQLLAELQGHSWRPAQLPEIPGIHGPQNLRDWETINRAVQDARLLADVLMVDNHVSEMSINIFSP